MLNLGRIYVSEVIYIYEKYLLLRHSYFKINTSDLRSKMCWHSDFYIVDSDIFTDKLFPL